MADFVLVHGAWHGGWVWNDVAPLLSAAGHRVLAPTLTGMGNRAHLLRADTGVAIHSMDILAVIDAAELADVILVGHSYGARPAALAAGHPLVRQWIALDGVSVAAGSTLMDGAPPHAVAAMREKTTEDGLALPPLPAVALGVPADHPGHDRVNRRTTHMPMRCVEEPMPALPALFGSLPRSYIRAAGNHMAGPRAGAAHARAEGWPMPVIQSGHSLPVTAPQETAKALMRLLS